MIGKLSGVIAGKIAPADPHRRAGRRLRSRRPDEHLLQPARTGREDRAADPSEHPRGRARPLRFPDRGRARHLPPADQDQRRRPQDGAVAAVGHVGGRSGAGGLAAGRRSAGEDPGHRQEDRRAPAARAQGQAQPRSVAACVRRQRRAADILQALVALGYSEKEAGIALKSLPADVGVSEGIKLAMKHLS
ncbi:holliday junction ATP-dependent DNA helicase RuvA [Ditylenchus destructor]|nr:holliday junction ATP-dependent DNA helicase RuvA [Ditylenchus destructor]